MRRWLSEDPANLLAPYLHTGYKVLEPGPGMGFFTLPMARLIGPSGRIVAVDIQPKMLDNLRSRASKAGLADRIETRLATPDSLGIDDLAGTIDFVLAFAMVHEMPSVESFFLQAAAALRPGGALLLAEPLGHLDDNDWNRELLAAQNAGLAEIGRPSIRRSLAALFEKF